MKVGLVSDVHACPDPLEEALAIFRENRVDEIFCAGDIAGYGDRLDETINLLLESDCQTVLGNHDAWHMQRSENQDMETEYRYLANLPLQISRVLGPSHLMVVHASPAGALLDGIRLLDEDGALVAGQVAYWTTALEALAADILIVGHTHQVYAEKLGNLLVINPGSTLFNHTCAILELPETAVTFYPLSGKQPVASWNFSMFREMDL